MQRAFQRKVAAGIFDRASTTGRDEILTAARVMVDLWDAEDGCRDGHGRLSDRLEAPLRLT